MPSEARGGSTPKQSPQTSGEGGEEKRSRDKAAAAPDSARRTAEEGGSKSTGGKERTTPSAAEKALATEKPVLAVSAQRTSAYVVTVDDTTGALTKIERLNEATGERKELSVTEYAQALAYNTLSTMLPVASAYSAEGNAFMQAYVQGMVDYLNTYVSPR